MAISRMQQPRQMYGLGSLVKSVTKGVKSAVKGVTGAVKDNPLLAAAALNFAPMLAGGAPFIGLGSLKGSAYTIPGMSSFFTKKAGEKTLGDVAKVFAGGSLLGGLLSQAEETGDPEGITRNVGALKIKLADAYRNQRTFADAEDEEAAIAQQVERDTAEYTQDMARGYAQGGRIGYSGGSGKTITLMDGTKVYIPSGSTTSSGSLKDKIYSSSKGDLLREEILAKMSFSDGGRAKYALGTPEQNAINASGIMNLPLNQNPAGVSELDLRETGGFIPPVGVKEKADDIPAMLSNNEFVFTADAVRGMGDGNVNKGAQRMYDMMKKLEKGGRV
jgi:hypothetical protein